MACVCFVPSIAGSCLHVDQCLWSNVGKNFAGYKVVAVWPFGHEANEILDDHWSQLFRPVDRSVASNSHVSPQHAAVLGKTVKMAILQPGDVFIFSGACAHMAMYV